MQRLLALTKRREVEENVEIGRKAVVVKFIRVLPQQSPGRTMENHKIHGQGSQSWDENPGYLSVMQRCLPLSQPFSCQKVFRAWVGGKGKFGKMMCLEWNLENENIHGLPILILGLGSNKGDWETSVCPTYIKDYWQVSCTVLKGGGESSALGPIIIISN